MVFSTNCAAGAVVDLSQTVYCQRANCGAFAPGGRYPCQSCPVQLIVARLRPESPGPHVRREAAVSHAPLEVVPRVVVEPGAAAEAPPIRLPGPIDSGQVPARVAERQENKDGPPVAEAAAHRGRSGRGRATAMGGGAIRREAHGSTDHRLVVLAAASQGAGRAVKGRVIGEARTEAIPDGQGVVTGVAPRPPSVVRAGRVVLVPRILAALGQSDRRAVIGARLRALTRRALIRRGLTRPVVNSGNGRVRLSGRVDTLARLTAGRRVVGVAMHRAATHRAATRRAVTVLIANLRGVGRRAQVTGAALENSPNVTGPVAVQMTGRPDPSGPTTLETGDSPLRGVGSLAKGVEGLVRRTRIARLTAKTTLAGSKPRPSSTTRAAASLVPLSATIRRRRRRKADSWSVQKGAHLSTALIEIGPARDSQSGAAARPRDLAIATAAVTMIVPAETVPGPMTGPIDRAIAQAREVPRGGPFPGAAVSSAPDPRASGAQAIGADRRRNGSRNCTNVHCGPIGSRQKINPRLRFAKRPGRPPTGSESPRRRLRLRSSRQLTIRLGSRRNLRQNCAERQTPFRKSCARPWVRAAGRGWNTS